MQSTAGGHSKWFKGIDSLRFILAAIVVLGHFEWPNSNTYISKAVNVAVVNTFNGTAAVIAFFIISGFVIHYPCKYGIANLKAFWARRMIRVFLPLLVIFVLGYKLGHPERHVIWSLICELIYYSIYPLLARLPGSWQQKTITAFVISFAIIIGLHYENVVALISQHDAFYQPYYWQLGIALTWLASLPVWLLGVLIAESIDKKAAAPVTKLIMLRLSVFAGAVLLNIAKQYYHVSFMLSMNIFSLLLFVWLKAEIAYYKTHKPLQLTEASGKLAYSIYLTHPLAFVVLQLWLPYQAKTYPAFLTASLLFAYVFFIVIEKPSHQLAIRVSKLLQ